MSSNVFFLFFPPQFKFFFVYRLLLLATFFFIFFSYHHQTSLCVIFFFSFFFPRQQFLLKLFYDFLCFEMIWWKLLSIALINFFNRIQIGLYIYIFFFRFLLLLFFFFFWKLTISCFGKIILPISVGLVDVSCSLSFLSLQACTSKTSFVAHAS